MQPPSESVVAHPQPKLHVRLWDQALGVVDQIVVSRGHSPSSPRVLEASGWAVSCSTAVPLRKVIVMVDGRPLAETARFSPRLDVARAYGRPDFELSGWSVSSSAESLAAGSHKVALRAVLANGRTVVLPGPTLTVD